MGIGHFSDTGRYRESIDWSYRICLFETVVNDTNIHSLLTFDSVVADYTER